MSNSTGKLDPDALVSELKRLRNENSGQLFELEAARAEAGKLQERVGELEQSYATLVALFVANTRLHASLDYVDVIRTIQEILLNLIGVASYSIYLLDRRKDELLMVKAKECDELALAACAVAAERTLQSGELFLAQGSDAQPPTASIPLMIGDEPMGAIVLYQLLAHKGELGKDDFDVLHILGSNAATALYAAKLAQLSKVERKHGLRGDLDDLTPPPVMITWSSVRPSARVRG